MKALAKRFIGKECIIASFDGNHQYEGVIKEVTDGAILVVFGSGENSHAQAGKK